MCYLKLFCMVTIICFSTTLTSADCHHEVECQVPHSEKRMDLVEELVVRAESWAAAQEPTHPSDSSGWPVGPRETRDVLESLSCSSRWTASALGWTIPRRVSLQ